MTYADTSLSTSATRTRCSWSTRPATSRREPHTVGVQRQYTGTAGRIENSQVAVYLTYAAGSGYAFIDRALYLPKAWTLDPDRCAAAGIPDDIRFATKPTLARVMLARALDAGIPARWAAGDEVYGADPALRKDLAARGLGFVLAVAKSHQFTTGIGARKAIHLAVRLPKTCWQRLSAGSGAKGARWYDWALVEVGDPAVAAGSGPNWLLIRRRISDGQYAFYRAHTPRPVPVAELIRVAGTRWKIEESFAGARNSRPWMSIRSVAGPPGTAGACWRCSPTLSCP
jgi:SRSO17 transposase